MIEGSIRIQKIEDCDGIDLLAGAFPADEAEEGFLFVICAVSWRRSSLSLPH